jgi:hypothetical protein
MIEIIHAFLDHSAVSCIVVFSIVFNILLQTRKRTFLAEFVHVHSHHDVHIDQFSVSGNQRSLKVDLYACPLLAGSTGRSFGILVCI